MMKVCRVKRYQIKSHKELLGKITKKINAIMITIMKTEDFWNQLLKTYKNFFRAKEEYLQLSLAFDI
jgi:hypothetical protein